MPDEKPAPRKLAPAARPAPAPAPRAPVVEPETTPVLYCRLREDFTYYLNHQRHLLAAYTTVDSQNYDLVAMLRQGAELDYLEGPGGAVVCDLAQAIDWE